MKIPDGMEQMIFSYAYYKISDFNQVKEFLSKLEEKETNGLQKNCYK